MQAVQNQLDDFPDRLESARQAHAVREVDGYFEVDSKDEAVRFLRAVIDGDGPPPETGYRFTYGKRTDLLEYMVSEVDHRTRFDIIQCVFITLMWGWGSKMYETLLLKMVAGSKFVHYIDMSGRRYMTLEEFEKHNTLVYSSLNYGEKEVIVGHGRYILQICDFIFCLFYYYNSFIFFLAGDYPDSSIGWLMTVSNLYFIARNVMSYYDQKRFGGYDSKVQRVLSIIMIVVNLVVFSFISVPRCHDIFKRLNAPRMTLLFGSMFITLMWMYNVILTFNSFWKIDYY